MKIKLFSTLLILSLFGGLLLTACSSEDPTSTPKPTEAAVEPTKAPEPTEKPPEPTEPPEPTKAPEKEPVTVSFWWLVSSEAASDAADKAIQRYMDANPNVTVEMTFYSWGDYSTAMPAALAAGNPPDVTFGDPTAPNLPNYVAAGQLIELTDVIQERGWEDRLQSGVMGFYNPLSEDTYYSIPLMMAERGLFYNKDILAEVGKEVPKTLAELEDVLQAVKDAGYIPLGMGNADKWGADYYWLTLSLLYVAQGDWEAFVSGTMKQESGVAWGGEGVRQGMEKLLEWIDKGYFNKDFASIESGEVHTRFALAEVFAFFNGVSMNGTLIEDAVEFKIGFMNLPPVDPNKPLLTISDPGLVLMLPKDSKHPDEALDIIDWLLQPEFGLELAEAGAIPLHDIDLSGVAMSEPFMEEQLAELPAQMPVGWLNYMAPYEFPDRQGSELQKLLAGDTDLDAYMDFLQATYNEAIANK